MLWIVPAARCHTQENQLSPSLGETLGDDAMTLVYDAGAIITSPLHFSGQDWLFTGGAFAGIAALHGLDGGARAFALRNQNSTGDNIASAAKLYGDGAYAAGGSIVVYTIGLLGHEPSVRETGLEMIEALSFAGAATTIAKSILGRSRPYTEDGPHMYKFFQTDNDYESLPSGHSTVAFALSSVLAARIKNRYATIGLFSVAGLAAYSRLYEDQHWLSDVVTGGAIGTAMGLAVAGLHEKDSKMGLLIIPNLRGATLVYRF